MKLYRLLNCWIKFLLLNSSSTYVHSNAVWCSSCSSSQTRLTLMKKRGIAERNHIISSKEMCVRRHDMNCNFNKTFSFYQLHLKSQHRCEGSRSDRVTQKETMNDLAVLYCIVLYCIVLYACYVFFRLRLACRWLITQQSFDFGVLLLIAVNCITLAMERPVIPSHSLVCTRNLARLHRCKIVINVTP